MNNQVLQRGEARFITKEGADTLAGKTPSPYLRLHDPVQSLLVFHWNRIRGRSSSEAAYFERIIHFWREVSLAGVPRSGQGMDECYALMFEAAFDLAEAEPEWASECLEREGKLDWASKGLVKLAHATIGRSMSHESLVDGFASLYAPARESEPQWNDDEYTVGMGRGWFQAALLCAGRVSENSKLWDFRCDLWSASSNGWEDSRLHTRLIREAPIRAQITPKMDLIDHPIIRIARLKYADGSVEQTLVNRFFNHRCIGEGFESEENYFSGDLTLAQWVRDARMWATKRLEEEPETCGGRNASAASNTPATARSSGSS